MSSVVILEDSSSRASGPPNFASSSGIVDGRPSVHRVNCVKEAHYNDFEDTHNVRQRQKCWVFFGGGPTARTACRNLAARNIYISITYIFFWCMFVAAFGKDNFDTKYFENVAFFMGFSAVMLLAIVTCTLPWFAARKGSIKLLLTYLCVLVSIPLMNVIPTTIIVVIDTVENALLLVICVICFLSLLFLTFVYRGAYIYREVRRGRGWDDYLPGMAPEIILYDDDDPAFREASAVFQPKISSEIEQPLPPTPPPEPQPQPQPQPQPPPPPDSQPTPPLEKVEEEPPETQQQDQDEQVPYSSTSSQAEVT